MTNLQRRTWTDRAQAGAVQLWTGSRPSLAIFRVFMNVFGAFWLLVALASRWSIPGFDTYAYWSIDLGALYSKTGISIEAGAYRYSPVVAQLLDPFGALSWNLFFVAFLVLSLLALVVLGGRWALAFLLIPNILGEVYLGNVDLFVAVATGFGLVWPPALALVVLTKATPAVVLLWFVVRREWRRLAGVVALTAAVALPSLLLTPDLWRDWLHTSLTYASSAYGASTIPIMPRLILAAIVVSIGAQRTWKWTIAVAATLAMPGLDWKTASVMLAVLPLYGLGMRADWPAFRQRLRLVRAT